MGTPRWFAMAILATVAGWGAAQEPPVRALPPGVVDVTPSSLPPATEALQTEFGGRRSEYSFSAEYLMAFPRRGAMDYAILDAANNRTPEGAIRNLDWGFSSGVRAKVGWRPGNGPIDFSLGYTYIRGTDRQFLTAPAGQIIYATTTRPGFVDLAGAAQASARLAYNVYDISMGRTLPIENYFSLRGSAGVRIAAINQDVDTLYGGLQADNTRVQQRNTYIGAGLSTGLEGSFALPNNFTLFGRAGGAMMPGTQRIALLETDHNNATTNANLSESFRQLIPVLEMGVGVTWQRYGYAISAGYELTNWFGLVSRPHLIDDLSDGKFARKISDLSIEAIFFRFTKTY